tara:strand:- start:494 stop:3331 length:2838 start_codon:yes stop_codon:yes gene_type:complete
MNTQQDRSGETHGQYTLKSLLGRGGMGEVYEAVDNRLGRTIAIKILRSEVVQDPARKARFEREAKALAKLKHPGIVTIYSIETVDDLTFITMDLVEGRTLTELIKSEQTMSVREVLDIGTPVADALAAAHKEGIVHRDIKPDNIIVSKQGHVTVLDFGLAKLATPAIEMNDPDNMNTEVMHATTEGRILGTVHYMSPEQAQGVETTSSTDVFSLGVVLYEMATGVSPFEGETTLSRLSSILKDEPRHMKELNNEIPVELERVIRRCLTKDPDRRWQTAIDLRNEMDILQEEQASRQLGVSEHQVAIGTPSSRGQNSWWLVLAAVAIVLTGFIAFWIGGRSTVTETVSVEPIASLNSDAFSITAPVGHDLFNVEISSDGRLLALHTLTQGTNNSSANSEPKSSIHLREMDAFESTLVPNSEGAILGKFSPDGSVFVFIVDTPDQDKPLQIKRYDLSSNLPPIQIGTIPRRTFGNNTGPETMQRGFCWLDDNTLVFTSAMPTRVIRIDARNGSEIGQVPLDFKDDSRRNPVQILDSIGDDCFLVGTDHYVDGRYAQDVFWANAVTGETGLVVPRTAIAAIGERNKLIFTQGVTLFSADYDPVKKTVSGKETPILSGLRTWNTWTAGSFKLSRNSDLVFLPGGLQGGERSIFQYEKDGSEKAMEYRPGPFEELLSVSGDGETLLVTHTNLSSGMWSIYKGSTRTSRLRSFASLSDRDIFTPIISRTGKIMVAKTHTSEPVRQVQIVQLREGRSDPITIEQSDSEELTPMAVNEELGEVVFTRREWDSQLAHLEVTSLTPGSSSRRLLSMPSTFFAVEWSPDNKLMAFMSTESGHPEGYLGFYGSTRLEGIIPVSKGITEYLAWSQVDGAPLKIHYISDLQEFTRTVAVENDRIKLGSPVATGRLMSTENLDNAISMDLSGRLYVNRKGGNERPASNVQMITNLESRLE